MASTCYQLQDAEHNTAHHTEPSSCPMPQFGCFNWLVCILATQYWSFDALYCLSNRIDHIMKGLLVTGGLGVDNSTELWATDQVTVNSSWAINTLGGKKARWTKCKNHCGQNSWWSKSKLNKHHCGVIPAEGDGFRIFWSYRQAFWWVPGMPSNRNRNLIQQCKWSVSIK